MSDEHTTVEQPSSGIGEAHAPVPAPAVEERDDVPYDPPYGGLDEDEDWPQRPVELAPRPRRRLLSPVPLALLAVLLTACGFIGGVLVEKGQSSSSSASSGGAASLIASRLSALRGGSSAAGAGGAGSSGGAGGSREAGGVGAGGARPVAGQVAYLSGSTLYVTNSEGNTLTVHTSSATSVTKSVKASVSGIHPGETVTVIGASASDGSVSAESIRVGSGGLGSLFAGGAGGAGGGSASTPSGGGPALFGPGG